MGRPPIMKPTGEYRTLHELLNEGLDYEDIKTLEEEGVIKEIKKVRTGWLVGLPVIEPLYELYDMC